MPSSGHGPSRKRRKLREAALMTFSGSALTLTATPDEELQSHGNNYLLCYIVFIENYERALAEGRLSTASTANDAVNSRPSGYCLKKISMVRSHDANQRVVYFGSGILNRLRCDQLVPGRYRRIVSSKQASRNVLAFGTITLGELTAKLVALLDLEKGLYALNRGYLPVVKMCLWANTDGATTYFIDATASPI